MATHQELVSVVVGLELEGERPTVVAPITLDTPLREVYRDYCQLVWRSLRQLGVPERSLEDATQDVFLVVHRRWREFEGRSTVKTWIYGIVLRVAKDYRRAETRHANRLKRLADVGTVELAVEPPPDEEAERREARRIVQSVLMSLSEEHCELLVLVELEQLSIREAASILGIHVRSCQRRVRQAHHAFEAALAARLRSAGRQAP